MTYQLTKHHSITIRMVWYSYESGNWSIEYILRDSITKSENKDSFCFDRWFSSDKENPAFICSKFIEREKERLLL